MVTERLRINEDGGDLFEGDDWNLPTDQNLVKPAEDVVTRRLAAAGWDGDENYELNVSFREALINAMKHGNKDDPNKKVKVKVEISKERVSFEIEDQGEGFDPEAVPDPLAPENILKGSGRGIFMMRNFFDSVTHQNNGRKIIMVKERK